MDWRYELEKFHDTNRYFIPLVFIAVILMITGFSYLGPVSLNYDVIVNRTLLFNSDAVILGVTLRPGWTFGVNVLTNKPVVISIYNLEGVTVASSPNNSLSFKPSFLDLYFVKVSGSNYAILDFNYVKSGLEPYPSSFLFFGAGLILLLGIVFYFLLEPWIFKLTRKVDSIDAVFYPLVFLLSSVIFWVFRDALIWYLPKNNVSNVLLIVIPGLIVLFSLLFSRLFKKLSGFSSVLLGYLVGYFSVFLVTVLNYSGLNGYYLFFIQLGLIAVLWLMPEKTGLLIYVLTWFTGLIIKVLAYSVGIPVIFDLFLTNANTAGTVSLFFALECFMVLGVYLFMRGYCAKTKAEAIKYGLLASVCVQAFLQVFTGTSLL